MRWTRGRHWGRTPCKLLLLPPQLGSYLESPCIIQTFPVLYSDESYPWPEGEQRCLHAGDPHTSMLPGPMRALTRRVLSLMLTNESLHELLADVMEEALVRHLASALQPPDTMHATNLIPDPVPVSERLRPQNPFHCGARPKKKNRAY